MKTLAFTIVTRNRIHLARVLMQSIAAEFPEAGRHVLVVDPCDGLFDPAAEPFNVTFGAELALPDFDSYTFVNDALSLCCLLKPAFALHLLERCDADLLLYADSDMLCHARPDALLQVMRDAPVALTPHVLTPLADIAPRTDNDIMRSGAFNAGFFAVRRSSEAERFLVWWLAALKRERKLDATFCHDQQFLSLAAVYFPAIAVLRDPGYNAAYWNLTERPLARDPGGRLTVGNRPLSIFHYSFFDVATPHLLANRPPLIVPAGSELMKNLLRSYADSILRAGFETCLRWSYGYGCFTDGKPITRAHQEYYLGRVWDEPGRNGSPFEPTFRTAGCHGLKSVYSLDRPLPRFIRWLRGKLR